MPEQQNIEYKSSWHEDYLKWVMRRAVGFISAKSKFIIFKIYEE